MRAIFWQFSAIFRHFNLTRYPRAPALFSVLYSLVRPTIRLVFSHYSRAAGPVFSGRQAESIRGEHLARYLARGSRFKYRSLSRFLRKLRGPGADPARKLHQAGADPAQ